MLSFYHQNKFNCKLLNFISPTEKNTDLYLIARIPCIRANKRNSFSVFTGHCCNFLQTFFLYFIFSTQPTCLFIPSVTAAAQNGIVDNHHPFHPILESIARPISFATFFLRVTLAEHLFFYLAILFFYSH